MTGKILIQNKDTIEKLLKKKWELGIYSFKE